MKKLLLIVLLLPGLVFADHHRKHAIDFLSTARAKVVQNQANLDLYVAVNSWDSRELSKIATARYQWSQVIANVDLALVVLLDPNGDLNKVRLLIEQPRSNTAPASATWRITQSLKYIRELSAAIAKPEYDHRDWEYVYRAILTQLTATQQSLNLAVWHIQDAIREEVYNDPGFQ